MKRLLLIGAALTVLLPQAAPVRADNAQVVSNCGTPNGTYSVGVSMPMTQDTNGRGCTNPPAVSGSQLPPLGVTTTNDATTVTTGGTFQSVIAASASRKGCLIENPTTATEPLFVFFGANASATTATSVTLNPGGSISCIDGPTVRQDNVSVTATTTGHAFYADNE